MFQVVFYLQVFVYKILYACLTSLSYMLHVPSRYYFFIFILMWWWWVQIVQYLIKGFSNILNLYSTCEATGQVFFYPHTKKKKKHTNSVALVREWTIQAERLPLVCEVSANFCEYRVLHVHHNGFLQQYSWFSSISTTVLIRLSGPHSRPTTQKIWQCRERNPRPLDL
jgi:hypothetical protein